MLELDSFSISSETVQAGEQLDIALSPTLCLTKEIEVPSAAIAKLDSVVQLAVKKSLPNGAAGVYWRYEIGAHTGKRCLVRIFLVKITQLKGLLLQVQDSGALPRTIGVAGALLNEPFIDHRRDLDRNRRFWGWLTLSLAAATMGYLPFQSISVTGALEEKLRGLKAQHRNLAAEVLAQRQEWEQKTLEQDKVRAAGVVFLGEHTPLPEFLDLTEALPDETWISELAINQNRLTLSGFTAGGIPDLIRILQSLDWVDRAELEGPIAFDSITRRNRFEIVVHKTQAILQEPENLQ